LSPTFNAYSRKARTGSRNGLSATRIAQHAICSRIFCCERNIDEETAVNLNMDRDRELLKERVLDATSLDDIRAARQQLREWIAAHPEEREWMRDGFEQLAQMEEIAIAHELPFVPTATVSQ
jgi:hypothetical protein